MHERNEQRRPSFLARSRGWGRSGKHFPLSRSLGEVSASLRLRFRAEGKVPQKPPHAQLSHPSCNTTEFTHERVRGVPPHFHKRRARRNHAISQRASGQGERGRARERRHCQECAEFLGPRVSKHAMDRQDRMLSRLPRLTDRTAAARRRETGQGGRGGERRLHTIHFRRPTDRRTSRTPFITASLAEQ